MEDWGWLWEMERDNGEEHPKQGTAGPKAWAWPEPHREMGQWFFPNLSCDWDECRPQNPPKMFKLHFSQDS